MILSFDLYSHLPKKYLGFRIAKPMYRYSDRGRHFCNLGFWYFEIQCFIERKQ